MTDMRLPGEYWESYKSWDYPVVERMRLDTPGLIPERL